MGVRRRRYRCDEPGCTGSHSGTRPYAERCPRTRRVRGENSPESDKKYNDSFKGVMRNIRLNIRQKEARSGAAD